MTTLDAIGQELAVGSRVAYIDRIGASISIVERTVVEDLDDGWIYIEDSSTTEDIEWWLRPLTCAKVVRASNVVKVMPRAIAVDVIGQQIDVGDRVVAYGRLIGTSIDVVERVVVEVLDHGRIYIEDPSADEDIEYTAEVVRACNVVKVTREDDEEDDEECPL